MQHQDWMRLALEQAWLAFEQGEVPVGAVIKQDGQLIASAHNEKETRQDPTAHAEILALRRAAELSGSWRLPGAILYVTLEPCPMCAGAMLQARIPHLVYGATDRKGGAVESVMNILDFRCWNHQIQVTAGILEDECQEMLQRFFTARRYNINDRA
ncbi:MAG: tRNA adenosine(34) deaminase TadA [Peptococcaceae bacterium]|jgi:tRNA(adenine34) deaminase|nr:tRNA adenosine(34) deaminase TadA [Peptococcaceae bacterium]